MSLFKPFRGNRASLDALEKHDGYAYFCVDDGSFHIDYVDANGNLQRKQINKDLIQQSVEGLATEAYVDEKTTNSADKSLSNVTDEAFYAKLDNVMPEEIYIGADKPTDENVKFWVDTDAELDIETDCVSPTVEVTKTDTGHRVTITDVEGEKSFEVKNGNDGKNGDPGANGYTPQRGTDYWTEEDKAEIKSYVDDAILGGAW